MRAQYVPPSRYYFLFGKRKNRAGIVSRSDGTNGGGTTLRTAHEHVSPVRRQMALALATTLDGDRWLQTFDTRAAQSFAAIGTTQWEVIQSSWSQPDPIHFSIQYCYFYWYFYVFFDVNSWKWHLKSKNIFYWDK